MNKRVVVLYTDDWQGLYIDGALVDEGHRLGEGEGFTYPIKMAEKYHFKFDDIYTTWVNERGDDFLSNSGNFPLKLSGMNGYYDYNK